MVVASWPGFQESHNQFIRNFLQGLERAGAEVVSVPDIFRAPLPVADIFLIHWMDRVLWQVRSPVALAARLWRFFGQLRRIRRQSRIVWIVHNAEPHELSPRLMPAWRLMMRLLPRHVDAALTLSPGTVEEVQALLPGLRRVPVSFVWHPAYAMDHPDAAGLAALRAGCGYGPSERVCGYCGTIRPYKGVDTLIAVFRQVTMPAARLSVAGKVARFPPGALEAMAEGDGRIAFDFRGLSYEEFNAALLCCDLVAAPLRSYLHSGSIVHALSAGRPVLTPRTPFSESLAAEAGADWVRLYGGDLTPARLETELSRALPEAAPRMAAMQPEAVGRTALSFFEKLGTPGLMRS